MLWAEADPEDSLQTIAQRAGFAESVAKSGAVAELCRDAAIIEVRDRRLLELQRASGVTVEDQLLGLQAIAADPAVPAKDRVAARKVILAWFAADKGQHREGQRALPGAGSGLSRAALQSFEVEVLGVALDEGGPT